MLVYKESEILMKIIIWFPIIEDGKNGTYIYDGSYLEKSLNILITQKNMKIMAVSLNKKVDTVLFGKKLRYIDENDLKKFNDICILAVGGKSFGMDVICKKAYTLGITVENIICDWILCLPGFSFDKYYALKISKLSIISSHCFGGIVSHLLGLKFYSPFVNLFLTEKDFIKFLKDPLMYVDEKLFYVRREMDKGGEFDFPVCKMGDIELHMNHYNTFDEATKKWYDRIKRINWFNLCIQMYTDDPDILEDFDNLPYGKKICFTSFKSNLPSTYYVNKELCPWKDKKYDLSDYVIYHALQPYQYDIFDMLLYGKKTEINLK